MNAKLLLVRSTFFSCFSFAFSSDHREEKNEINSLIVSVVMGGDRLKGTMLL